MVPDMALPCPLPPPETGTARDGCYRMQLQAGIANHPVRFGVGLDARDSGTCHTQIMRESEERKSLVRRDPKQSPAVLRRTTPYVINGRTAYYTSGRGVSVVTRHRACCPSGTGG